jgi:hypothetical protein
MEILYNHDRTIELTKANSVFVYANDTISWYMIHEADVELFDTYATNTFKANRVPFGSHLIFRKEYFEWYDSQIPKQVVSLRTCDCSNVNDINDLLQTISKSFTDFDISKVSDGYHTFEELYEHRCRLWIALCRNIITYEEVLSPTFTSAIPIFRTKLHSDGSSFEGWFVLGIVDAGHDNKQLTYHLPISLWNDCDFAETLERAPGWDGHTSADVLERLKQI